MKNLSKYIGRFLNPIDWSELAEWSRSFVVRSSYFWFVTIPIAVKFLSKISDMVTVQLFGHTYTLVVGLPFSWWMFYFSSVAFAAGRVIFAAGCPDLVRRYATYSDFQRDGASGRLLKTTLLKYAETDSTHRLKILSDFIEHCCEVTVNIRSDRFLNDHLIPDERKSDAFYYVRTALAETRPFTRFVCAFFYCIGITLLAVTSLDAIRYVVTYLWG